MALALRITGGSGQRGPWHLGPPCEDPTWAGSGRPGAPSLPSPSGASDPRARLHPPRPGSSRATRGRPTPSARGVHLLSPFWNLPPRVSRSRGQDSAAGVRAAAPPAGGPQIAAARREAGAGGGAGTPGRGAVETCPGPMRALGTVPRADQSWQHPGPRGGPAAASRPRKWRPSQLCTWRPSRAVLLPESLGAQPRPGPRRG